MTDFWNFVKLSPDEKKEVVMNEGEYVRECKGSDVYQVDDFYVLVGQKAGSPLYGPPGMNLK